MDFFCAPRTIFGGLKYEDTNIKSTDIEFDIWLDLYSVSRMSANNINVGEKLSHLSSYSSLGTGVTRLPINTPNNPLAEVCSI